MSEADDLALIHRCAAGDTVAWNEFVERFSRLIYDAILRTLRAYNAFGAYDAVEDVYHDVFVALLDRQCKALRVFEGRHGCRLASYLRTIAVRRTIDCLRLRKSLSPLEVLNTAEGSPCEPRRSPINDAGPEEQQHARWLTEELFSRLRQDEQRFCRLLVEGTQRPADIAKQLGISLPVFYVRKHRLLRKLRRSAIAQRVIR